MKFDFSSLSKDGMIITFIKKDGKKRVMRCTTNLNKIPLDKHPKSDNKVHTDGCKRVFDLEKNEWRSFIVENVISAKPLNNCYKNAIDIINVIKEKYEKDKNLIDMIKSIELSCNEMQEYLKQHKLIYSVFDYSDEELKRLDDDVVCELCSNEIYNLIKIHNRNATEIKFKDESRFINDGKFIISYSYLGTDYSRCYDDFYVTINELRDPEIYKIRREEENNKIEKIKFS